MITNKSKISNHSNLGSTISKTPQNINKSVSRDIDSPFFDNLMKMNQNSLQDVIKKIVSRICLLEKKFDDNNNEALNESKIKKLDKELNNYDTI